MKTAVSLSNDLFESAEKLASKMKISRSELFQNAIKNYIEEKETTYITNKLNEIYSVHDYDNSSLDPVLNEIQLKSLQKNSSKDSNETW
jgi:metal-responsive CopG/Arc/MetJ family transcriptional regulator